MAVVSAVNFLANRYDKSYDTTANKQFTLSDQTIKIAKNLKQPITITYWEQPTSFQGAKDLLDRYQSLSPDDQCEIHGCREEPDPGHSGGRARSASEHFREHRQRHQEAKSLTE